MKQATITIPDDLELELESYLDQRRPAPSLASLIQTALRRFLEEERLDKPEPRLSARPFRVTAAENGSGEASVSLEHDRYLAEIP